MPTTRVTKKIPVKPGVTSTPLNVDDLVGAPVVPTTSEEKIPAPKIAEEKAEVVDRLTLKLKDLEDKEGEVIILQAI